jgi:low molecular weight phosphotyrosine protein phosphatase
VKVCLTDLEEFDYIFAMDRSNLDDLKLLQQQRLGKAKVKLFGEYLGGKVEEVEDPSCGENEGFELVYEQSMRFSKNFLKAIFPNVEAWVSPSISSIRD